MAKKQAAIYIVTLVFELVLVLAGDGIILLSKNTIGQPHDYHLGSCEKQIFVDDVAVIDVPYTGNCSLKIETQKDRILAFTIIATEKNIQNARQFFTICEEINGNATCLAAENTQVNELQSIKDSSRSVIFSTQSSVKIRLKKVLPLDSGLQLKIQKAVNCPANLGSNSECSRAVDEVSCYCALLTSVSKNDSV